MKKQQKRTYIKLFNIPEIAQRAMKMLSENPPRSYSYIANKLGCDRSSVIHFHKKKIKEELSLNNFNGVKIELIGGSQPEVINIGQDYKDYCKKYIKKRDKKKINTQTFQILTMNCE